MVESKKGGRSGINDVMGFKGGKYESNKGHLIKSC